MNNNNGGHEPIINKDFTFNMNDKNNRAFMQYMNDLFLTTNLH